MDISRSLLSKLQDRVGGADPRELRRVLKEAGNDLEAAEALYRKEKLKTQAVPANRKRRRDEPPLPPPLPLFLGLFPLEAYSISFTKGLRPGLPISFTYSLPTPPTKPSKSKQKPDHSIRFHLSTSLTSSSIGRIPVACSGFLHSLLCAGAIAIQGTISQVAESVGVMDPIQIDIRVWLAKTGPEASLGHKSDFSRLFTALKLEKTKGGRDSFTHTRFENIAEMMIESEFDKDLLETEPVATFRTGLLPHQKRALTWMLEREGEGEVAEGQLWEEYRAAGGETVYFNGWSGEVTVESPKRGEAGRGGILADEMGLGKTVMMSALVLSNPSRSAVKAKRSNSQSKEGQTLLIVPLSLLPQWLAELSTHTPSLSVTEYYANRCYSELTKSDIVLTTYGTVASEFAGKGDLFRVDWFRVVLDEGHAIRNRNTTTAKACCQLKSKLRWVVTGTPVINGVDDLFSYFHFLSVSPWSDFAYWTQHVSIPLRRKDPGALSLLHQLLTPLLLRRTKTKELRGILPELIETVRTVEMTDREREIYRGIWDGNRTMFRAMERYGVTKNCYATIFEMLLRLRQACDHPYLVLGRNSLASSPQKIDSKVAAILEDANSQFAQELSAQLKSGEELDCPVCLGPSEDPVLPPCGHLMCRTCAYHQVETNANCPLCKRPLRISDLKSAPRRHKFAISKGSQWESSSKIDAVIAEVQSQPDQCVVFTQWTSMMDLIEAALKRTSISFCRLDGDMTKEERGRAIRDFERGKKVMLVSVKAGGGGLNLVMARRVVLVDPGWSRATEQQAIERLHRIGQSHPVEAIRLVTKDSIEERLLHLQHPSAFEQSITEGPTLSLPNLRILFENSEMV